MKIIYIAKHGCGLNDDEGAIKYAFKQLGHTIECIHEDVGYNAIRFTGDLLLFHKWNDINTLNRLEGKIKRVIWYFDLVDYPDSSLQTRCQDRKDYLIRLGKYIDYGFFTDGDWVNWWNTSTHHISNYPTAYWLPQGADERVVGFGERDPRHSYPPFLFTGTWKKCGMERELFVRDMRELYGSNFNHVQRGVYQRNLANLIASSAIVLAPYGPITHNYFSNRIYMALGFGAFMFHPYCNKLIDQYTDKLEVVYYHNELELRQLIDYYMNHKEERQEIAQRGFERTLKEHLYRHRCEQMLKTIFYSNK